MYASYDLHFFIFIFIILVTCTLFIYFGWFVSCFQFGSGVHLWVYYYFMQILLCSVGIVADSNAYDQSKRMRTGGDYTHTGYSSPSPFHQPPAPVWGHHG